MKVGTCLVNRDLRHLEGPSNRRVLVPELLKSWQMKATARRKTASEPASLAQD